MVLGRFPGVIILLRRLNSGPMVVCSNIPGDLWVHLVKIWLLELEVTMASPMPSARGPTKHLPTTRVIPSHLISRKLFGKLRRRWDVLWLRARQDLCSHPVLGAPNIMSASIKHKGMSLAHSVRMSKPKFDVLISLYSYLLSFSLYRCSASDIIHKVVGLTLCITCSVVCSTVLYCWHPSCIL